MKIYTKTGDRGETGLFGGERVSKNSQRIEAYGTIDELNSFVGLTIIEVSDKSVKDLLQKIQNWLFSIGADLATPDNEKTKKLKVFRTPEEYYLYIEKEIDKYEDKLDYWASEPDRGQADAINKGLLKATGEIIMS